MGKTRNNSLRMQQAVKSIFEDYRQKQGCLGHVYEEAACGCNNALQMWRGPKGEKGDKGDKGDPGSNAGSFLVSAEFVVNPAGQPAGSYLKLVLRDENDQLQTVYVDLSALEDVYTAGNGISITDMVIAAKLGAGLTFDNQGNIASAYQFCDGLENAQNTITVKLDENNNILGFAGSGCKGLTATVGFDIPTSGALSLRLYGAEGAIIDTVPLSDSATIDVQRTSDGGLTWLVNMENLISSTEGNQLTVDPTDQRLYVGGDTLSYAVGEGTFTVTHPDGSTSSVTVPSAVRMLERADMVCDDGEDPYLLLTFLRDNGQHLYQQVSMGCLFSSDCYETVVDDGDAIIKTVPEQSQQYAILRSINGITTVRTSLYGVVSNQASDLYAHNGQVALSGDDYAGVGTMVTSSLLSIESLDSSDNVIDSITIPAEVRALPGYGMSAGEASNDVLLTDKKYVQHVSYIDLGSLNYIKASYDVGGTKPFFSVQYAALGIKHADNDVVANIIDGVHRPVSANRHSGAYADMTICVNSDGVIRIADSRYSSAADFKAAMSGVILQYELATPVVTDISQYINDDEIEVVEGGSIRFNSDTGFAVSSTVVFTVGDWYLEGCVRTSLQHELRHMGDVITGLEYDVECVTEPVAQNFSVGVNIFDGDGSTLAAPVKLDFVLYTPASSQEKTFGIRFGADGQGGVSVSYPYTMFIPHSLEERGFDYFRDESVWLGTFNVHYAVPLSNGCVIDTWTTEDPDHPGSNSYGIVHAKLYGPKASSPRMVTFSSSGTDTVVTKTLTQGDTDTMPVEESVFPYPTANTRLYYSELAPTAVALTSTAYVSPYLGVSLKLSDNTVVMAAPANSAAWWPNEISHAEIDTTLSNGVTAVADLDCLAGYVSTEFARQDEAIAELTARIDELRDLLFDRTRLQ